MYRRRSSINAAATGSARRIAVPSGVADTLDDPWAGPSACFSPFRAPMLSDPGGALHGRSPSGGAISADRARARPISDSSLPAPQFIGEKAFRPRGARDRRHWQGAGCRPARAVPRRARRRGRIPTHERTPPTRFVHLRLHTEYSISDGISLVDQAVSRAAADGMPALGISDLANLFGMVKFSQGRPQQGRQADHRLRRVDHQRRRARQTCAGAADLSQPQGLRPAVRVADPRLSREQAPRPRRDAPGVVRGRCGVGADLPVGCDAGRCRSSAGQRQPHAGRTARQRLVAALS